MANTGVTVKPWTGIFMLRNLKSPETYFQSAFRVQSPWEVHSEGVGLYSTVLSRADYDSLSGKTGGRLAASVTPDYKPSR